MTDFTVTTLIDENDGGAGGTGLSLREALALANSNAVSDNITFAAGLAGGTIFLSLGAQLEITSNGTTIDGDINGDGRPDITIDADSAALANDAASRVFRISNGGFDPSTIAAALNGLVIRDGNTTEGAGIWVGPGDVLTLTNATVSGNTATSDGGGIFGESGSSITLANATVSGNSAVSFDGGGIFGLFDTAITLVNTTVSGNSAGHDGGGIFGGALGLPAVITLTNSTVTGNSAAADGGGILGNGTSSVTTLTNSIVAGNAAGGAGDDLFGGTIPGHLAFTGGNIIGSAPGGFATTTGAPTAQIDGTSQTELETVFADVANDPNTGVLSGVLADNGGAVQTVAIASNGIARDAGDSGELPADTHDLDRDGNTAEPLPVDARGFDRTVGASVDVGAFESGLQVTTLDDELAATTDLATELADGNGLSLREALAVANGDPSHADIITFASALAGGTLFLAPGNGHLPITTDGITVDGDINGDGTPDITIDADSGPLTNDAASRVFLIDGGVTPISAALNGLVIRDGNVAGGGGGIILGIDDTLVLTNAAVLDSVASTEGGAIRADDDTTITLINVTLSGNTSSTGGGGIYADNNSVATLINSTVSGNRDTGQDGGGLYSDTGGTLTLINSTVWGNSTTGDGGGIYGFTDNVITLINSTVTGNSAADSGGGIYNDGASGVTTLINSIVAGNYAGTAADDLYGGGAADLVFTGNNIIGSAPVGFVTVTGAPTHQIDGTSQADLETVFADVALVDPDGAGGNAPFLAGVLADNGGPVQTVAIQPLGLAHNGGDNGVLPADTNDLDGDGDVAEPLPVDARGLSRVLGVAVDIGAVEITPTPSDFDGSHTTDILWRNDEGTVDLWTMQGLAVLVNQEIATIPNYWHIIDAEGDYDGDGRSDLLWQDDTGLVVLWTMDGATILSNTLVAGTQSFGSLPDYWNLTDTGDFTGDARADILWRDDAGRVVLWEMNGADIVSNQLVADVPITSQIEDTADFTGDGMNDILWRDDDGTLRIWEMDGVTVVSDTTVGTVADTRHLAGTGDFNGDGRSDILWRDDDGTVRLWEMDGANVLADTSFGAFPAYWEIADLGDYNGDLNSDILWRDTAGTLVLWEMDGHTIVDNSAVNTIGTQWHVVG